MDERSFSDHMHHAFQFPEHLIIRESKNDIVFSLEPRVPLPIVLPTRFKVVTLAIEFDDQPCRMTDKIGDVVAKRNLPPETQTFDPMRLDVAPQQSLCASHPVPKFFRSTSMLFGDSGMGHVSNPPP